MTTIPTSIATSVNRMKLHRFHTSDNSWTASLYFPQISMLTHWFCQTDFGRFMKLRSPETAKESEIEYQTLIIGYE